ncbi:hypothetical protein G6O46_23815, partial [Salmonella enterica subsp. enterica serovar Enteritidis]|uniref:glycosyl hydrolase n=1 Tax=Salmonella enterica TaxID=28901 RepID=UPI0016548327|nr:hypothetical protein [Salmonella enterica subsp. enterica serovar Enteritidis]
PTGSPSLSSDSAAVRSAADALWGDTDGRILVRHAIGAGQLLWGPSPEQVLEQAKIGRDFDYSAPDPALDLRFAHRRLAEGDLYFVTNQSAASGMVDA